MYMSFILFIFYRTFMEIFCCFFLISAHCVVQLPLPVWNKSYFTYCRYNLCIFYSFNIVVPVPYFSYFNDFLWKFLFWFALHISTLMQSEVLIYLKEHFKNILISQFLRVSNLWKCESTFNKKKLQM